MKHLLKLFSSLPGLFATLLTVMMMSGSVQASNNDLPKVRVVTSEGAFVLQLRPDVAPKTVKNFLDYVEQDFYEGTIFHRVIAGFMIQGGGFTPNMMRKPTQDPVVNEATETLPNLRGTIAMARTQDPDSATSQFFINVADNDFLNAGVRGPGYTVFGKVTEGMGVVDRIARTETRRVRGMADVPSSPIVIKSITRLNNED
ncbi:peptidylprolyl isomerase [Marinobacter persicus]|jgi:peptidyl-prolyl cis-trans isomerase A (cyclophilin A)|uniref:Peptidyl-prolyl cis-trans isomerase n=1 Tax=Marinobacter persicus TaxID=930118 RepID=A0A2S6G7E3_9GAMM|nr:peptidyl-prolyl cis-trans isomerase A (cyclophilin A) [Marinobacter persicus]PPK55104.1 peptidyl-prolyl cis-trans isomerase A (cyclophilin A) [Marinobacter persicus]PPK58967.1 peptidyl-prolyl cis-trans isomerase A (cyclophilin A) [Marinobacter persicus]